MAIAQDKTDLLGASSAASRVEAEFTAVVLNVGLTQLLRPPVLLLAACAAALPSGTAAFFQPESQRRASQERFGR